MLRCRAFQRFLLLLLAAFPAQAADKPEFPNGGLSSRSFVDQAQIVSKFTTELYAHQSSLRIVKGIGYAAYQCNETSPEENKPGQVARLAIFNILDPKDTARWVDISQAGDASNGLQIAGRFVSAPMLHRVDDATLRVFFTAQGEGAGAARHRVYFKDYSIPTGTFSGLHQVRCTIANDPAQKLDLTQEAVQKHLDFLFGAGAGDSFSKGISTACDYQEFEGRLYSAIQIKNSEDGVTRLMTNVLMRSADQGATWELLGAPDPRLLPGEIKILAEPAIVQDQQHVWLYLRSNVVQTGYVLCKAGRDDLFHFDAPRTVWTYGIGRPTLCDYGRPIGLVALFTAPSVPLGGQATTRNKCDVVRIDASHSRFTKVFSIVDYNAVNTPFMQLYNEEVYVSYSTGRRRLIPKFGTSEIMFSKLRREFFIPAE